MAQAVIQVAQLKIGYGERCVLKDASFSIGAGEIVGIMTAILGSPYFLYLLRRMHKSVF